MKHLLQIVLLITTLSSCAQVKSVIQTSYAYSQVRIAGTMAVNEDGNPIGNAVSKTYHIYLETKGQKLPVWKTAKINSTTYSVTTMPTATEVTVGVLGPNFKPFTLRARPGNRLSNLQLKLPNGTQTVINEEGGAVKIILEGTLDKKRITYTINEVQELPQINGL